VSGKTKKPRLTPEALSALSHMTDEGKREAFLRSRKLLHVEVIQELNAATLKELRVNTTTALSLAEAAIVVARSIRANDPLAQSYRVKANVLAATGDYQPSIELYNSALAMFEKAKNQEGIARTLTAVIQPHIMLGSYDQAFQAAERAQGVFVKLGDGRRLARLENNIGNIYHRQDRFEEALTHYELAYQQLLPHGDSEELAISLNNMSMCLITMNDFARALATYDRAKDLLNSKDLPLIRLITDYNIAYLYYLRGDYRRAIEMLKIARLNGEKIGYTYLVALCYLDLSDIYVELNLSGEAQDVAEEGYLLFRKLEIAYEAAKTLANQAIALGQEGKTQRALELFAGARPLFVQEKNEVWPWLIDLYQAIVLFHQGRHYEARRLALGAAQYFDGSCLTNKAASCHLLLAQVAMRTGDAQEATAECSRAIEILTTLDSPILRYQGEFLLGQIEQAQGKFQAAYRSYQKARTDLESLRSCLSRDELKISFMKNRTEIYERLVELCLGGRLEGASHEEAFDYIERAKSRSLTELIFQRNHALPEAKPGQSELVHKIRDLREELNWYQHRIEMEQLRAGGNSEKRVAQLNTEAQAREKELLRVLGELPESETGAAAMSLQAQIPLEKIRSVLRDEDSIVEYFFLGESILAAVLTKHSLEILPITTVSRVSESLRLLRFQLGKFQVRRDGMDSSSGGSMYRATVAHLGELYNDLIDPIRKRLDTRHLVFVPHGILHYLPFHALHDGKGFLLDSYTVSYAPSAAVYALCYLQSGKQGNGSLILGVPDAQAPLIQQEVEAVHHTLPGSELFLGETANHDLLFRMAPERRLIHIATHGNFRPDNPMFSGIRLSDGYLYLYEFYHMQLCAELVALSGCATGLNVVAAGDELLGLIRGALYAGARSLMLSLWDVNDRSTAEFMTLFYGRLGQSKNNAAALAEATKELREQYPHPYYWAPFVLVGKALSGNLSGTK
jgi:CHAT domain-containing protein